MTWMASLYVLLARLSTLGLCLAVGATVAICGCLTPLVAGVPLRACWRLLGWSQEPLLREIWRTPKRLVFAGALGALGSGGCFLWGLWHGSSARRHGMELLLCNAVVFSALACYSFIRFKLPKEQQEELEAVDEAPEAMSQRLVQIEVDGRDVGLRVHLPARGSEVKLPCVVMVCGLLWLGEGLLGSIGLAFNDALGRALAQQGMATVQLHTPQRHLARTRLMELALTAALPLCLLPGLRALLLATDLAMLATSKKDLYLLMILLLPGLLDVLAAALAVPMLLLGPLGWFLCVAHMAAGLIVVPLLHGAFRLGQYWLGELEPLGHRDYLKEVSAAVTWASENRKLLGSDGRLVLCGYSSGGHVAALYGAEHSEDFEAVVLVSGIYDLRTDGWQGLKSWLCKPLELVYADILGLETKEERALASPVAVLGSKEQKGLESSCVWWLLNAKKELMGLPYLEEILFDSRGLASSLESKGAVVKRAECGYNHWLLVFGFPAFAASFCASLAR